MTTQSNVIDTHVHVFKPKNFSYSSERSYTPGEALEKSLVENLQKTNVSLVVLVQPSVYGYDNRAMLSAVEYLGLHRARGVAVIDPLSSTIEEVESLGRRGVRAIRANLKTQGVKAADACIESIERLGILLHGSDMMLQLYVPAELHTHLKATFAKFQFPIILDHFGGLRSDRDDFEQSVEGLMSVLSLPNTILKASGACRVCNYQLGSTVLDPIAPVLFEAAKGRVIWGSDWPHTGPDYERVKRPITEIEPFQVVNDVDDLADIRRWAGSQERYTQITYETPAALFGF